MSDTYIKIGDKYESAINQITGSFSGSSFVGTAKILIPYTDARWETWNKKGEEVTIYAGAQNSNKIFHGTIKNPIREEKYIRVHLLDYGQNFQKEYTGTFKNKEVGTALYEMCEDCGYKLIASISPAVSESVISRSKTIEYGNIEKQDNAATMGETSTSICGVFLNSDNMEYGTCVKNYCTYCGKYNSLTFDSENNQYKCTNCNSTYDGITGKQNNGITQLSLVSGPEPDAKLATSTTYSGTGTTYEDEIRSICENNNLYMYLTQNNECVIKEFRGTPKSDITLNQNLIEYKSYGFLNSANQEIKTVRVNYNKGVLELSEDATTTEKITLDRPELDKDGATKLAEQTLIQQLKNILSEIYVTVPLSSKYSMGKWVSFPDSNNIYTTMYLDSFYFEIKANKVQREILTLQYTPSISNRIGSILSNSSVQIKKTFDQIAREASLFKYDTSCQQYICTNINGRCDSHGMSRWLYTELTKIGLRCRIISYDSPYLIGSDFWCIQLYTNGGWSDFNYSKYNFDERFFPTGTRTNLQIISGN